MAKVTKHEARKCNDRLIRVLTVEEEGYEPRILVLEPGERWSEDEGREHRTVGEALIEFWWLVGWWLQQPNWEAQAAYDDEWGTINGYGPHQYGREY